MASEDGDEAKVDQIAVGFDIDDGENNDPPASRSSSIAGSARADGFMSEQETHGQLSDSLVRLESAANVDDTNIERTQNVTVRNETAAMGMSERWRRHISSSMCWCGQRREEPSKKDDDIEEKPQYTVKQKKRMHGGFRGRCLQRPQHIFCFGSMYKLFDVQSRQGGFSTFGRAFVNHLNWLFRASFLVFFAYTCLLFYALVLIFAGFIAAAGRARPECVRVGGDTFGFAGIPVSDAFSLSWHTFSTVGYGSVYPALSADSVDMGVCSWVSLLCVVESFVGILYGAMVGSVLFGKIVRIQSRAQVVFSDPVLVRYGSGVAGDVEEDEEEGGEKTCSALPCPVLEFRIANRLNDEVGGEILDASINAVASLDADEADTELRKAAENPNATSMMKALMGYAVDGAKRHSSDQSTEESESVDGLELGNTSVNHVSGKRNSLRAGVKRINGLSSSVLQYLGRNTVDLQTVDEDPTNSLAPRRVFSHLLMESSEHPYFKRAWIMRHFLTSTSPLLTAEARRVIRKNGGHWPNRWNSAEKVRECIQFNQILVSLHGISNVSGSEVYAQKIYDYVDLAVGYHFVNMLFNSKDGNLNVDLGLINDVKEQRGGGGEDLLNR